MSFKKVGYKSVKLNVETDWAKKSDKEPTMDREKVAYGQIVKLKSSERKITKIFDKDAKGKNVIDQDEFSDVLETAVDQIIKFYDKEDTPENRKIVRANTIIEDIRVTERPGSPVSFYVLSDAKSFDNIPSRGQYTLQIVDEGDTLHTLANKYKNYLSASGSTEIAHRARIAEILKANGIEICTADEEIIKGWISSLNKDKDRDTSFDAGVEIYLPNIDPPDESHPDIEHIARVEIGDMTVQIEAAKALFRVYEEEIKSFQGKVENLNLEKEINLLDKLVPALRKHFIINEIAMKDVINDAVDIGFDTNFKPLFVTLDRSGERIPLTRGLIVLEETSPFNNPRTMALTPFLAEISNIKSGDVPWKNFLETYIFPKVKITSITSDNLYSQLQSDTVSVIDQLDERFGKTSVKTDNMLDEEDDVLGNPEIIGAASEQSAGSVTFTGDLAIHNLTDINAKIGLDSPGVESILAAYSLLLNKISIESLMKAAVECLQAQFPFSCEELLLGILESNIGIAANAFKGKIPAEFHFVVDEALEFARTGDYEVFHEASTEMQTSIETEDPGVVEADASVKFTAAFKAGIVINTSLGYEEIIEDVCAFLTDFTIPEIELFALPVLEFPDDLPSVDLMASVSISLESAIIETIVGLILKLIESLINEITNACSTIFDTFGDIDFGSADLAEAVADKVGVDSAGEVLSDLFDSLGGSPDADVDLKKESKVKQEQEAAEGVPPTEEQEPGETISYIDLEPVRTSTIIEKEKIVSKVAEMNRLLENISALLTPSEVSALFTGTASLSVLEFVLNIIKSEHSIIGEKVRTLEDVAELFTKLSKLADVQPIFEQVTVINKSLGCTWDSFCERKEMISANIPDVPDIPGLIESVTPDKIKIITDIIPTLLGGPLTTDPIETFCEEKQSKVDKGLIPKDNASIIFLIEKVVNVMYDGIYMAFDDEIVKLPDALDVIIEVPKLIPRTIKQDSEIATPSPIFDFFTFEEKDFSIPLPSWFPKRTIMNPEFQRLLGTGYIPLDGDPQGKFGPYTTEKIKLLGILPTPFNSFPLDPVIVNQKLPLLAANSRAGLRVVKDLKVGNDVISSLDDVEVRKVYFALSEPFKGQGFKAATFVLKYSLFGAEEDNKFNNTFSLQVGNVPIDPSSIPMPPPNDKTPALPLPSVTYAPMEAAVFHTQIYGGTSLSENAKRLIDFIQEKKGLVVAKGNVPQMDVFAKFVELIVEAGLGDSFSNLPQLPPGVSLGRGRGIALEDNPADLVSSTRAQNISQFVKNKMFDDLIIQAISGIAAEILNTPLFKKTSDKTPFIKIIDWAPIPTEEERLCGSDPHILALDTVKKRTIEAYENYIECSPLEDEISTDGLGRPNLSSLEAAGMTGCVMTTIRAYVLEQLIRSMYAVSVFVGEELVTRLLVEYFVTTSLKKIKELSESYHDSFLEQVEVIFKLRMDDFNPFGSIPDVIANGKEIGIDWKYADAALFEYDPIKYAYLNPNDPKPPDTPSILEEELGASTGPGSSQAEACETGGPPGAAAAPLPLLPGLGASSALYDRVANRVKFLAEEQLYSVIPKLQDLISIDGTLSFDDNFLGRRLPMFDLQKNPGEVRFAKVYENSLKNLEQQELIRQYGEYLKEFEEFENNRLGNLLTSGIESIKDIASSVGASVGCLSDVFDEAAPNLTAAIEGSANELIDAFSDVELFDNPLDTAKTLSQAAAAAATAPLQEVKDTFDDLTVCATDALDDFVEVGKDVLSAVSDSPAPLDTFVEGAAIGSTDQFGNIGEFSRGDFQTDFTLTDQNGTIILEKYIKVRKKGGNSSISSFRITVPRNTSRSKPGAFSRSSMDAGGSSKTISQILCPREKIDTSSRTEREPIDSSTQDNSAVGETAEFSLTPKIDPEIETIYNIEEWEEQFSDEAFNNRNAKFEDIYESWSFGVRMTYIAPTNNFVEPPPGAEPGETAPSTIKVPSSRGPDAQVKDFLLGFDEEIVKASKSFTQYEEIEVNKKIEAVAYEFSDPEAFDNIITSTEKQKASDAIEGIDSLGGFIEAGADVQIIPFPEREPPIRLHGPGDAFDVSPGIIKQKMERRLTLIPLSEVEIPIVINKNTKLKDVLTSLKVGTGRDNSSDNLQDLWNRKFMGQLLKNLKDSPGYNMLFKYCAPSNTMLSFTAVYANLLNEMPDYFFDKTKFELKKLFEVLLNGGDYTFEGEEEKKSGGNRGAAAQAKGNMGTSGDARKPGLFDLAIQTPKLIFKGLTEFIDPVIAISSAIVKAGKAGKLFPKVMKELDAAGQETEENYLLKVEYGPFDLPPPIGKMPNPFSSEEPEEFRPGMADNIKVELPMFELKDAITGQSLSPFLQLHFFKFQNGTRDEKDAFRRFSLALAMFNIPTLFQEVLRAYLILMKECPESPLIIKLNGVPSPPIPTLELPGDKMDLPLTPIAMSLLPMDVLGGYGPGPPHTPLGHIYHGLIAAEQMSFPNLEVKERQRKNAGFENKKKLRGKLCIDIEQMCEEEGRRIAEDASKPIPKTAPKSPEGASGSGGGDDGSGTGSPGRKTPQPPTAASKPSKC